MNQYAKSKLLIIYRVISGLGAGGTIYFSSFRYINIDHRIAYIMIPISFTIMAVGTALFVVNKGKS